MDSKVNKLKLIRKKAILMVIGYSLLSIIMLVSGYVVSVSFAHSNYITLIAFMLGIGATYCVSLIPHLYQTALAIKIEIKNNVKVWELIDDDGKVFASYESFIQMQDKNQDLFQPSSEELHYHVKNKQTGESKGVIDIKQSHGWKSENGIVK